MEFLEKWIASFELELSHERFCVIRLVSKLAWSGWFDLLPNATLCSLWCLPRYTDPWCRFQDQTPPRASRCSSRSHSEWIARSSSEQAFFKSLPLTRHLSDSRKTSTLTLTLTSHRRFQPGFALGSSFTCLWGLANASSLAWYRTGTLSSSQYWATCASSALASIAQ